MNIKIFGLFFIFFLLSAKTGSVGSVLPEIKLVSPYMTVCLSVKLIIFIYYLIFPARNNIRTSNFVSLIKVFLRKVADLKDSTKNEE